MPLIISGSNIELWQEDIGWIKCRVDGVDIEPDIGPGDLPITVVNTEPAIPTQISLDSDLTLLTGQSLFLGNSGVWIFDGNRRSITVDGVEDFPGVFADINTTGTVKNLHVNAVESTLLQGGGAIALSSEGVIVNCGSSIDISQNSGGIVGNFIAGSITGCNSVGSIGNFGGGITGSFSIAAGRFGAVSECYSSGSIGDFAGGIIGGRAAESDGHLEVSDCNSTGDIIGQDAGGIVGFYAANGGGQVDISESHSTGVISGTNAGGIVGNQAANAGGQVNVDHCYSLGGISGEQAGGISGAYAGYSGGQVDIIQSYSSGEISGPNAGGIVGFSAAWGGGQVDIVDAYSWGVISGDYAGGIVGGFAASGGGQTHISQSYSTGAINGSSAGGIVGVSAAAHGGSVNIHESYSTGSINGTNSGGIAGSSSAVDGGAVDIFNVYSMGAINGIYAGGIVGPSAGYDGGRVSLSNVFSTGNIVGIDTGGIFGDGIGLGSGGSIVYLQNAYTSGIGNSELPNGTFSYQDGLGLDNVDRSDIGLLGSQNYSEANHVNSGIWTDAQAIYTDTHPYGLISAGHSSLSDVWLIPLVANTPFTLAVFDEAPTLSTTTDFSGATKNQFYTISFDDLLEATDASDPDGVVSAFQLALNGSSGQFYTGASLETANVVVGMAMIDPTHSLYWKPSRSGNLHLGDALAEDNLGAYSETGSVIRVVVSDIPVPPARPQEPLTITLFGCELSQQAVTSNTRLNAFAGGINVSGGINAIGGASVNQIISASTVSNIASAQLAGEVSVTTVSDFLLGGALTSGTLLPSGYNYFYLTDFQGASHFKVHGNGSSGSPTNFLTIINQTLTQNIDLSSYQGIALVGKGINVMGITPANQIGTLGDGSYYLGVDDERISLMGPQGYVHGGDGMDTVCFVDVSPDSIIISRTGDNAIIWCAWKDSRSGLSYLQDVERIEWDYDRIAFDTAKGEIAGSAYRLYKAAFDRVAEADGLGFWIEALDNGANLNDVAQAFINSDEFTNIYGANPTDQQFVTKLYNHVLHRAPEGSGYQFWLDSLSTGGSRAQILKDFSESAENINQTAGLIANGIYYQEWVV